MSERKRSEDIVLSTLTEIAFFFIFLLLIGLGFSSAGSVIKPGPGEGRINVLDLSFSEVEDGQTTFQIGEFRLSESQVDYIRSEVTDKIVETSILFGGKIVEVVGYADTLPHAGGAASTLDSALVDLVKRGRIDDSPVPDAIAPIIYQNAVEQVPAKAADNPGLSMLRATLVARELILSLDGKGFTVVPLSGAHLATREGELITSATGLSDPDLRRIEIRVREKARILETLQMP